MLNNLTCEGHRKYTWHFKSVSAESNPIDFVDFPFQAWLSSRKSINDSLVIVFPATVAFQQFFLLLLQPVIICSEGEVA